jgi:hypothetical protein
MPCSTPMCFSGDVRAARCSARAVDLFRSGKKPPCHTVQVLPLDEWVFNTEAHPFPLPGSRHEVDMRSTYLRAPMDLDLRAQHHSPVALQQAIDHFNAQLPPRNAHAGSALR